MTNEIIIVRQLPVIEEQLLTIKTEIEKRVAEALALECTEENVKTVKTVRTELMKDFKILEDKRKEVKKQVMSPYDRFEEIYKDCVTNQYKPADEKLKQKIDDVENELKARKKAEIVEYFNELCTAKDIDFVTFESTGAVVTLSASKKGLREKVKAFLDKTSDDLAMINTQEHSAEILVEYKKSLNVSQAILVVKKRNEAIAEEKAKQAEIVTPPLIDKGYSEPSPIPYEKPTIIETAIPVPLSEQTTQPAQEVWYKVSGTAAQLSQLEEYMSINNIAFEQM